MNWKRDCVAVIPCFNEADHIRRVVAEVQNHVSRVLVVDDGSTDATAAQAAGVGAEVLQLPHNSGKGAALRHGWQRARELGFQWVMMLDGDGQHAAEEIPQFFQLAEKTGARLVVGNRMNDTSGMPFIRRCVNRLMSRWISNLVGKELPDSQCGFRLAHLETLLRLPLGTNRFEIESAMLTAFFAAGKRVEFVPVRTIYEHRVSKIDPLADTVRWLRWGIVQRPQRASLRACSTMRVP
ncbi:MAG TPA: glycosyltransferase family 2 protein [Candidatus Binatia bacterium]|nr:glycosyltransferase family 2 protein [Candidatus Binatia bacterium]